MDDLAKLLQRLNQHEVQYVLVGGLAAVVHGVTLVTRDVDVCCAFTPGNLERLGRALADLHPVHRMTPQRQPLELTPELCAGLKNLYLQTDWGVLDCLSEVKGLGDYDAVRQRSLVITLPFGPCRVLDLEGLITAKEAMDRPQDKLALLQLKAIREHRRNAGSFT
jgi:hypothetical protein